MTLTVEAAGARLDLVIEVLSKIAEEWPDASMRVGDGGTIEVVIPERVSP